MSRTRLFLCVLVGVVAIGIVLGAWRAVSGGPFSWAGGSQASRLLSSAQRAVARDDRMAAKADLAQLIEQHAGSAAMGQALMLLGQLQEQDGDAVAATATYQRVLRDAPASAYGAQARAGIERGNVAQLFSPLLAPADQLYEVQPGDTIGKIARRFGINTELVQRSNRLTSDLIRPGQQLKMVGGVFSVRVDKSDNILILQQNDAVIKQYRVATGDNNATPEGTFTIVNRLIDPPWYTAQGIIPSGSPENILGTRWLGFDKPSYGIHGTSDPSSIGTHATAGCVRMHNADVEELFVIVPVGTSVTIVD